MTIPDGVCWYESPETAANAVVMGDALVLILQDAHVWFMVRV